MKCFYDENDNIKTFDLKKENIIGRGSLGVIYSVNNSMCLKIFDENDYQYVIANHREMSLVNNLKLKCFYEIYDFLFNKDKEFLGYTMKYYEREDIDILTMPTSYTLDNFYHIFNSIMKITDNGIGVCDMHYENVIMNQDGITIIDIDDYFFNNTFSSDELLNRNNSHVRNLFMSLYYNALKLHHEYSISQCRDDCLIEKLALLIGSSSGIDDLYKELDGYKYPIDYIKKLSKRR